MQTSFDFNSAKPLAEVKELKVSELSNLIKRCIEDNFGTIRVKGEISGLKIASSGHGYFNLKDEEAILACTCWRPVLAKLPFQLKDGMEIIATGRLTTYGGQSRYQLSVERIETAGIGALMQILQDRKEKLAKEGLFDPARKKPLPFFPKKIGIITSPTGAVIQDILHRISDRCPTHILLWPVAVQGESSAFEISSAINGFNHLSDELKPDLIIVARGGGSIEDLWSFNEEIVVRATANSKIPIISAVGHETDVTLIDFAADRRAPTPTAAAEFAVPVLSDLIFTIKNFALRVENTVFNLLRHQSTKLEVSNQFFKDPNRLLFQRQQRLDELSFRLSTSLPNNVNMKSTRLDSLKLPFTVMVQLLAKKETLLANTTNLHSIAMKNYLNNKGQKLSLYDSLLGSLDIKQILKRGFSIVKTTDGGVIDSASKIPDQNFTIEWHDGSIEAKKVK